MNWATIETEKCCLFEALQPAVEVDGQWQEPVFMAESSPGVFQTELPGQLELVLRRGNDSSGNKLQLQLINRSAVPVRLNRFRFRQTGFHRDFLATPGERLRLYREGWTMASACGSVRYGETDYKLDPDYQRFAVSSPGEYDSTTPNRFSAEYVTVLNDRDTGHSLLAGFISSADQFTRFAVTLAPDGVSEFAAYSYGDDILVDPGQSVLSEELVVLSGPDGYTLLEEFGRRWGQRMNALPPPAVIPTGWCSWYYYFEKVTEADILENARYLAAHRTEYPVEYLQLDDGYQAALGDWLTTNNQFPHGLEALIREIKQTGLKPGLWLAPFLAEEHSRLFAEHPDWMIRNAAGQPILAVPWRHNARAAVLDGTHPEVQAHFRQLFGELVKMGVEYVKLDFLMYAAAVPGGIYHDPRATRVHALRRGLLAIREAMGEHRFILGCTAPLGAVIGLVNGERTGTDILPRWKLPGTSYAEAPTVYNVCRNLINRRYMHRQLWVSDPDVLIARTDHNELTENEVMLWFDALYLLGGMTLLADRFATLAPDRAELGKILLRDPDAFVTRPLDLFDREFPSVWWGTHRRTGAWVLGLFNFADVPEPRMADLKPIRNGKGIAIRDHWTGRAIGHLSDTYVETVAPHSARLLDLIPLP